VRSLRTRILGIASAVLLALVVMSSLGTGTAGAINPPQTTVSGTVNALYNDVNYFSRYIVASYGKPYRSPGVGYGYNAGMNWFTDGCSVADYQMASYCKGNVYMHQPVQQSKLNRLGDYASGFWLAHEMGHHIATSVGWQPLFRSTAGRELFADCVAGVFTKYGYNTGRLAGNDYWEAMATLGDYLPNEGSPGGYPLKQDRKAWFQWGYGNYNVNNCAWYTLNLVY
jgi:hypothetical protein